MASVETKPIHCQFLVEKKDSSTVFIAYAMPDSVNITKELLALNTEYPELQIKAATQALKEEIDRLQAQKDKLSPEESERLKFLEERIPFQLKECPTLIFEINIAGVYKHVFPFMTKLFNEKPKIVEQYSLYPVSEYSFKTTINELFLEFAMPAFYNGSRCYVETLGRVAQQSFAYQGLAAVLTDNVRQLPKPVAGLVSQYLNAIELDNIEDCKVSLHEKIGEFKASNHQAIFRMPSTTTANMMQKFFNGYVPRSSTLEIDAKDILNHVTMNVGIDAKTSEAVVRFESAPDQKNQPVKLIVNNQALVHPTLLSEMKSVLFSYQNEVADRYLFKSDRIEKCRLRLQKLNNKFKDIPSLENVYTSINELLKLLANTKVTGKGLSTSKEIQAARQLIMTNCEADFLQSKPDTDPGRGKLERNWYTLITTLSDIECLESSLLEDMRRTQSAVDLEEFQRSMRNT